jgi:hypothetical protein
LLIPEANELDTQIDSFLGDFNDWDAYDPEDDRDANIPQTAGNYLGACWRCHIESRGG